MVPYKTILFSFMTFVLSGCATLLNPSLVNDCNLFAREQKRDENWLNECISGNSSIINEGYKSYAFSLSKDKLCSDIQVYYGQQYWYFFNEAAYKKKYDCDDLITKNTQKFATNAPATTVCSVWLHRSGHPAFIRAYDDEVKKRGLDCVAFINNIQQQQRLVQIQNLQNQTLIQQQNTSRPIETTCNVDLGQVKCISQQKHEPDLSVFDRLKSKQDYDREHGF